MKDKDFTKTKCFQTLMDRWKDKDMETYFVEKNKEFHEKLRKEFAKKSK